MLQLRQLRPCLDDLNATQTVIPTQGSKLATSDWSPQGEAIQSAKDTKQRVAKIKWLVPSEQDAGEAWPAYPQPAAPQAARSPSCYLVGGFASNFAVHGEPLRDGVWARDCIQAIQRSLICCRESTFCCQQVSSKECRWPGTEWNCKKRAGETMVSAQARGDVSSLLLIPMPGLRDGSFSWYGANSSD